MLRQSRKVPVLLGAAVSVALVNVLGTVTFNLAVWVLLGEGIPIADAYSKLAVSPFWWFVTLSIPMVAAAGGGYTAAVYSPVQPQLNAVFVGTLVIAWYLVMLASPLQLMKAQTFYLLASFVVPIPAAIVGAIIRRRTSQSKGRDG